MSDSAAMQSALVGASSSDTVRTRIYTGKPAWLLKTRWTQAWAAPEAPDPLPMLLQNLLVSKAHNRIHAPHDPPVVSMPAGQVIGRIDRVRPVAAIVAGLVTGYAETLARLDKTR